MIIIDMIFSMQCVCDVYICIIPYPLFLPERGGGGRGGGREEREGEIEMSLLSSPLSPLSLLST